MGVNNPVTERRVVRVKLTDEQIELLKPKYTGKDCGMDTFENINLLSIQND